MKKKTNILVSEYSAELEEKVSRIEKKAVSGRTRRIIVLLGTLLLAVLSVFIGDFAKNKSIEKAYRTYCETNDRTILTHELIDYLDVKEIFESASLGNTIIQTHMNGCFYENESISIYPDLSLNKTNIRVDGQTRYLCDGIASNINVFEDKVYFRNNNTMRFFQYDIQSHRVERIDIVNVGQLAVCDGLFIYTDIENCELKIVDEQDAVIIVADEVDTFSVIGNEIIYLRKDHSLHQYSMYDESDSVIGNNVNSYVYDGLLWIQNNTSIYCRKLGDSALELFETECECHRILGASEEYLYIDDETGICLIQKETHEESHLNDRWIFAGASGNGTILVYRTDSKKYKLVEP